jgi:protein required for attachment to host cells
MFRSIASVIVTPPVRVLRYLNAFVTGTAHCRHNFTQEIAEMMMTAEMVTWFVVADGAKARFLVQQGMTSPLSAASVPEMTHLNPPTREQGTDRPGRTHESTRSGTRHAMTPRVDWHRFEKEKFAHEVAERVNRAIGERAFDRLVLVAPPTTLGTLRDSLGEAATAAVTHEIAKDITHLSVTEMSDYLTNYLYRDWREAD